MKQTDPKVFAHDQNSLGRQLTKQVPTVSVMPENLNMRRKYRDSTTTKAVLSKSVV